MKVKGEGGDFVHQRSSLQGSLIWRHSDAFLTRVFSLVSSESEISLLQVRPSSFAILSGSFKLAHAKQRRSCKLPNKRDVPWSS